MRALADYIPLLLVIVVIVVGVSDLRPDVPGIEIIEMVNALEAGSVVWIAASLVLATFRVGA